MSLKPEQIEVGRVVCVEGQGMDNSIHSHRRITKVTKTQIVLDNGGRYTREDGQRSIPYVAYGGSRLYATCQRPEDPRYAKKKEG